MLRLPEGVPRSTATQRATHLAGSSGAVGKASRALPVLKDAIDERCGGGAVDLEIVDVLVKERVVQELVLLRVRRHVHLELWLVDCERGRHARELRMDLDDGAGRLGELLLGERALREQ